MAGLGIAYAGSQRQDLVELLLPLACDTERDITESSLAALALGDPPILLTPASYSCSFASGLILEGSCDDEVASALAQRLMESSELQLAHTSSRFLCLGLGLLFLGQHDR